MSLGSSQNLKKQNPSFIVLSLGLVILLTALAATSSYWTYNKNTFEFFDFFWMTLSQIFLVMIIFIIKANFEKLKLDFTENIKIIGLGFFLFIVAFIGFYFLQIDKSIWRDELFHYKISQTYASAEACRRESQPALSCSLAHLWNSLFKNKIFVFYIDNFIFGMILLINLLLVAQSKVRLGLALLLLTIFMSHPQIINYLFEFRPIIIGLTMASISITFFNSEKEISLKHKNILVFIIEFLSIMSLGLQNLALSVILCLIRFVHKSESRFHHLIALLIFLPFQIWILIGPTAQNAFWFKSASPTLPFTSIDVLFRLLGWNWILFLILAVAIALPVYKSRFLAKHLTLLPFIKLFTFLITLFLIFKWVLNIQLVDRYLVIALLISYYLVIDILFTLQKFRSKFLVLFLFIFLSASSYSIHSRHVPPLNKDQKSIFKYLSSEMIPGDRFVMTCVPEITTSCYSFEEALTAAEVYFKPTEESIYSDQKEAIYKRSSQALYNLFKSEEKFGRLFVIIEKSPYLNFQNFLKKIEKIPNSEIKIVNQEIIIVLSGDKSEKIKNYFEILKSEKRAPVDQSPILQAHFAEQEIYRLLFVENNFSLAKELYNKIKQNQYFQHILWKNDQYKFFEETNENP